MLLMGQPSFHCHPAAKKLKVNAMRSGSLWLNTVQNMMDIRFKVGKPCGEELQ